MTVNVNAQFTMDEWNESTLQEFENGGKFAEVRVKKTYTGDLEASGTLVYLMSYQPDGAVNYAGYERIDGTLKGQAGSFVIEDRGTFEAGVASSTLLILPGSGSGALKDISGNGSYRLEHAAQYPVAFTVEL